MTIKHGVVAVAMVLGAAAVTGCNGAVDAVKDEIGNADDAVAVADAHRFGGGSLRERRAEARREHRAEERRERRQEARREHRAEERREHRRHQPWWRRFW